MDCFHIFSFASFQVRVAAVIGPVQTRPTSTTGTTPTPTVVSPCPTPRDPAGEAPGPPPGWALGTTRLAVPSPWSASRRACTKRASRTCTASNKCRIALFAKPGVGRCTPRTIAMVTTDMAIMDTHIATPSSSATTPTHPAERITPTRAAAAVVVVVGEAGCPPR